MLTLIETKIFNQLKNGQAFDQNTGDFTTFLLGNVGEKLRAVHTVDLYTKSEASEADQFTFSIADSTITRETGSWVEDGINKGDLVDVDSPLSNLKGATVVSITDLELTLDSITQDGTTATAAVWVRTPLEDVTFKMGLIDNEDAVNFVSKIDGQEQVYFAKDVRANTPNNVTAETKGLNSWITGQALMRHVQDLTISTKHTASPDTIAGAKQQFEITHDFIVTPYFLDGELDNITDETPTELYNSENTLKLAFEVIGSTAVLNPNSGTGGIIDNVLGNVGYYGESFNGFPVKYAVDSIAFTDVVSGLPVADLQVGKKTIARITISSEDSKFIGAMRYSVSVSDLPLEEDYQNNNRVEQNFNLAHVISDATTTGDTGFTGLPFISKVSNWSIALGKIVVDVEFDYTDFENKVFTDGGASVPTVREPESGDDYAIWVMVGDTQLDSDKSDKVALVAKVGQWIKSDDVPGLFLVDNFKLLSHRDEIGGQYTTDLRGWVQDGIMCEFEFEVDLSLGAVIQDLAVNIASRNESTGDEFFIQENLFDFSNTPINSDGVQEIAIDEVRGFRLADGSHFNFQKITKGDLVGTKQKYKVQLGIKINWEEYRLLPEAPDSFVDVNAPNDGLNLNTSNYLADGYQLRVILDANVSSPVDKLTAYKVVSPDLKVFDFNADASDPSLWHANIQTLFGGNDTSLHILEGQKTRIKATFTADAGEVTTTEIFGIIRIEENETGGPVEVHELSSFRPSAANNPLVPVAGESFTKITISSNRVILECDVEGLDPEKDWFITARIGDSCIKGNEVLATASFIVSAWQDGARLEVVYQVWDDGNSIKTVSLTGGAFEFDTSLLASVQNIVDHINNGISGLTAALINTAPATVEITAPIDSGAIPNFSNTPLDGWRLDFTKLAGGGAPAPVAGGVNAAPPRTKTSDFGDGVDELNCDTPCRKCTYQQPDGDDYLKNIATGIISYEFCGLIIDGKDQSDKLPASISIDADNLTVDGNGLVLDFIDALEVAFDSNAILQKLTENWIIERIQEDIFSITYPCGQTFELCIKSQGVNGHKYEYFSSEQPFLMKFNDIGTNGISATPYHCFDNVLPNVNNNKLTADGIDKLTADGQVKLIADGF